MLEWELYHKRKILATQQLWEAFSVIMMLIIISLESSSNSFLSLPVCLTPSHPSIHPSVHSTQVVSSLVVPWSLFNKLSYALLQKKTLQQKVISTTCKAWITHTKCFSQFPDGKRRYHGSLYDRQFVSRWETAAVSWGICIRPPVSTSVWLTVCLSVLLSISFGNKAA